MPVLLGVCLLPSHSWQAEGKDFQLQLQSFIQPAWGEGGMQEPPEFADIATQPKEVG